MVERLLGSEASTALRGCPTRLLLPGAARAADGSVLAYSPPTVPGVEPSELCLEGRPWARPATARGGVAAFELGAVALVVEGPLVDPLPSPRYGVSKDPTSRLADEVRQGIEPWFLAVRAWVEVYTGQDLDHEHPRWDAWVEGHGLRLWEASGREVSAPSRVILTMTDELAVDDALWTFALDAAGRGDVPDLEHLLLRDSRSASLRGQRRRAVLDAATAVEVVAARLDNLIAARRPPALGMLLKRLKDGGVIDGHQRQRLQSELVEVRNAAIHRGQVPDPSVTAQAVGAATEFVSRHAGLRWPLSGAART